MANAGSLQPKISIIGAGNVGTRCAYALMIKSLAREIVITDIDRKRLEGEVEDLAHSTPYINSSVEISAGDYPDIKDSVLVILTAGAAQKPGQTRLELVKENIKIFREIVPGIMEHAPEAILLVVTNPVDVLSYAAWKISGKDPSTVIGSGTVLDTARFRYQLAKHCGVDSRNVHAYILGEHGDTEFPVWSRAMVGGSLMREYCPVCSRRSECDGENELDTIFNEVKNSAYRIIEKKGETSYGIGLALARITAAVTGDENSVLPVSVLARDYMGANDVYLGLPSIVNGRGVKQILPLELNPEEKKHLQHSAETLKAVLKKAGF